MAQSRFPDLPLCLKALKDSAWLMDGDGRSWSWESYLVMDAAFVAAVTAAHPRVSRET